MRSYALRRYSQEEVSDKVGIEREKVFYGTLSDADFERLVSLTKNGGSIEKQEQYSILKPRGSLRVRQVVENEATKYIMTAKQYIPGAKGVPEKEEYVSAEMYEMFKYICDSGMRKVRHIVVDHNGRWEYDIFYNEQNERYPWCKVDLEDSPAGAEMLPVPLGELYVDDPTNRTPAQKEFISNLYEKYFTIKPN